MRIIIGLLALAATTILATEVQAQAGDITKGDKYVNYKFPEQITASKTVLFPTAMSVAPAWVSDSVNVSVSEFYTHVKLDTLRGTRRVKLSAQGFVTGGAQVVIEAVRDTTTRSLVVQHSGGNDTLSVSGKNRALLWYTGSKWLAAGKW